jgi:small subunit ribosomal protein S16
MLIIRLQRTGKKNQADFRIVLAEKAAPVTKQFNEVLGSYNPRKKTFQVKEDRLKYWLNQRVALSETVNNLLVSKGLVDGPKVKAFSIPKKPVEAVKEEKSAAEAVATPESPAPAEVPMEVPAAEPTISAEMPAQ